MPFMTEADGGKIKPRNFKDNYTPEQAAELLKCQRDPIYFIEKYVMIQHPKMGAIPMKLFEFQKELVRAYDENQRTIAILSRQCGKTTSAAAYLLWWAMFKDDQTILVASKDQDGANELMERFWYAYEELPWWLKSGVKKNDVRRKHFSNGTKIRAVATTKTSGRGKSNSLVYLDEFAFVRPSVAEEFWTAIYPTLSTGGKCIITSTPNTDEDKFAKIWFNALMSPRSAEWVDVFAERRSMESEAEDTDTYQTVYSGEEVEKKYKIKSTISRIQTEDDDVRFIGFHAHWTQVPMKFDTKGNVVAYRDEKFKRETLAAGFTEEQWAREFDCAFVSGDSTLVSGQKLAFLKYTVKPPRFIDKHGVRWYEAVKPNTTYAVTLDPSDGVQLDDACIQVWEIPTLTQVAEWNDNNADQQLQARILRDVLMRIKKTQFAYPEHDGSENIWYSVERNGLGVGILNLIMIEAQDEFPGQLVNSTEATTNERGLGRWNPKLNRFGGLITTGKTKRRFCLEFKNLIERNLFVVRREFLASQLKTFVKKGQQGFAGKEGSKDDIVMGSVLMCHLIDELRRRDPYLDDYVTPALVDYEIDPDEHHPRNEIFLPSLNS